jgi:hypothetical protein
MPSTTDDPRRLLEPLVPLFSPYCGGVAYQPLLQAAVAQLLRREWTGERPLSDGRVHRFVFAWQGEPAPLETLACSLSFPDLPALSYTFDMPAYQLVYWLMQRQNDQLPVSFWHWLLTGTVPAPTGDGSDVA